MSEFSPITATFILYCWRLAAWLRGN